MKRTSKTKKGFTLVELIVVLVILAILAAMLVPALTGYIKRARQEKDYQMAATVLTAAQAAATYQYSKGVESAAVTNTTSAGNKTNVATLVGNGSFSCTFNVTAGVVTDGDVTIGDYTYHWDGAEWTAKDA